MSVGMPVLLDLEVFAWRVEDYFGETPFLVGSAVKGKEWRDVDVRLMLDEAAFARIFGQPVHASRLNPAWAALCGAFAALGKQMTGLPIDFQVQLTSHANKHYGDQPREPLGIRLRPDGTRWSDVPA